MSEHKVVCSHCSWKKGPYTGTLWKTSEEQARAATGRHVADNPIHHVEVVECPT